MADPILLGANQPPDRFYLGGRRIAEFRHLPAASDRVPEDWIGSTTTLAGHASLGLTVLPDGRRLVDVIAADAVAWLGPEHLATYGTDPRLLVKLLDAGQRLPVHAHPDAAFAHRHLGRQHGKAEAWSILSGGTIYLGLKEPIGHHRLASLVDAQSTDELLGLLHRREVHPGDTVFVPPGMLHAIGEGVFLVEAQEPEDLSILLEWKGFDIDGAALGHLGLGFDVALGAVTVEATSDTTIEELIRRSPVGPVTLAKAALPYFRISKLRPPAKSPASFAVLVATDGDFVAAHTHGELRLASGDTVVIPHAIGDVVFSGHGEMVICRPPSP